MRKRTRTFSLILSMCMSDALPSVAYLKIVATILITGASSIILVSSLPSFVFAMSLVLISLAATEFSSSSGLSPPPPPSSSSDALPLSSVSSSESTFVTSPERPLYCAITASKSCSVMRKILNGIFIFEEMKFRASLASILSGSTTPISKTLSLTPIGTK